MLHDPDNFSVAKPESLLSTVDKTDFHFLHACNIEPAHLIIGSTSSRQSGWQLSYNMQRFAANKIRDEISAETADDDEATDAVEAITRLVIIIIISSSSSSSGGGGRMPARGGECNRASRINSASRRRERRPEYNQYASQRDSAPEWRPAVHAASLHITAPSVFHLRPAAATVTPAASVAITRYNRSIIHVEHRFWQGAIVECCRPVLGSI